MSLAELLAQSQLFLLVFARTAGMVFVTPLLSSRAVPAVARVGLALFTALAVTPWVGRFGYPITEVGLQYAAMIFGEALIGIILGFMLNLVYSSFQLAGQLFSLQMGFAASQVYDPLAQLQIPLVGQFLNLIAMLVLLSVGGLQKFLLAGFYRSFESATAYTILVQRDSLGLLFISLLGKLFGNALIIALPIMGTLFLISLSMGLLAKAAPQMNLLMLGFPINISMAFLILLLALPILMGTLASIIDSGWVEIVTILGGEAE